MYFSIMVWQQWGLYHRGACDPLASEVGSSPVWRGPCRSPAAPVWWVPSAAAAAAAECGCRRTPGAPSQRLNHHVRALWSRGDTWGTVLQLQISWTLPALLQNVAKYLATLGIFFLKKLASVRPLRRKSYIWLYLQVIMSYRSNKAFTKSFSNSTIPVWFDGWSHCSWVCCCCSCCCCCLRASFFI